MELSEGQIRDYIGRVRWQESKDKSHSYTLEKWSPEDRDEFYALVQHIRDCGYVEWFRGVGYVMFDVGEYRYWTMGWPIEETILINRKKSLPGNPHRNAEKVGVYLSGPEPRVAYVDSPYYLREKVAGELRIPEYHERLRNPT